MTESPVRNFRDLFVLRARKDDGIVVVASGGDMTRKTQPAGSQQTPIVRENGINLEVPGSVLITQAKQRIAWHKQNAATIAAELRLSLDADDLREKWRRLEISRQMRGHEEHARFLTFIASNLKPSVLYRVGLNDLSHFEIMPKGSYL